MKRYFLIILISIISIGCSDNIQDLNEPIGQLFNKLDNAEIGLEFTNDIHETPIINYYTYTYLYNGSGVGIGDINNDGLPDVYLSSTMGQDKLFLNLGDLKFKDISTTAGINNYSGHKTGVNFTDINNDGWLDIYVCRSSWSDKEEERKNLLFINNKDNTFSEQANSYDIDDANYGVQSVFFDYDRDGDNDLFISNHPGEFRMKMSEMIKKINTPALQTSDKLYRNNGNNTFTDVTAEAGIINYGYGLGVTATDFNNDGFIDIYVANDFDPHDYYYLNQGDGTFKESLKEYFPHCSYFSMGLDVTDINHDGFQDMFVVEMLSEDNVRQKTNMAPMDMKKFDHMVENNLHYQYMRNAFQINNGNGYFSDIAYYSGIDKTDWSWGTLFGDYDNDGDDDLIVVNGYLRDTQDKDFASKSNKLAKEKNNKLTFDDAYSLLQSTRLSNYVFRNKGEYKFENASQEWGFDFSGYSNGVAYGDLDMDGDLDIIVNNVNDQAGVYENTIKNSNFIGFHLIGPEHNKMALNAKLELHTNLKTYYREYQVSRGFQSSCDPTVHFGLTKNEIIDSLIVKWSNTEKEKYSNLSKGEYHNIQFNSPSIYTKESKESWFAEDDSSLKFIHEEIIYDDYAVEVLLPHKLSQLGPALCTGDVNNDGRIDVFVGGAHKQSSQLLIQNAEGQFIKDNNPLWITEKAYEDVEAEFFDVDSDNDLDLIVHSGSNEFVSDTSLLKARIYLNKGDGNFTLSSNLLPEHNLSGGCIAPFDYDKDGDIDLFVGGRLIPGQYPSSPKSLLLENTPTGFVDVTSNQDSTLSSAGLITDAVWTDFNNDGNQDLIVVGEWTDIQFFENRDNQFVKVQLLEKALVGWWNCIKQADIDQDGDMDYILGNLGENYKYQASDDRPFEIYAGDFDGNSRQDIVVGYYSKNTLYPVRGLQCSSEQIPDIKKKFPSYKAFGEADLFEIYGDALDGAIHYSANIFSSIILENNGDKTFKTRFLPPEVQMAPVQDIIVKDLNGDQLVDIITAGNWFVSEIETPRADNGVGTVLLNQGDFQFTTLSTLESGIFANKDVRNMAMIPSEGSDKTRILIANNDNVLQVFEQKK